MGGTPLRGRGLLPHRHAKLRDWDTTLALFTDEYHVPLLSPSVAAFIATGAELALPVLLVAGLFGRFAAAVLSVLNVVAMLSLADITDPALQGHIFWGSLLAALLLWGPGRLSIDRVLMPRWRAWVFGSRTDAMARYTAASLPPQR